MKRDAVGAFYSLLNSGRFVGGRSWGYKHEYWARPDGSVLFCQANLENPIDVTSEAIDPRMVLNSMEAAGVQETDREAIERELNEISIAVWSLGYCAIRQMLETARTITIESAGSEASIVSTSDWGRLSLDVSEHSGWLPERFEVVKGLDDLTVNGTVREVYEERCDSVIFRGYASGFSDQHSGFPVPDYLEVIRVEHFKSGEESKMKTSVHHDEIEFGEALVKSDLEFTIDLPPGLPVTVAGALQLPYEWNGEDAVPSVPGLSALRRNEAFGSSGFWILVVIHAVLLLVLLTAAVLKRKHA